MGKIIALAILSLAMLTGCAHVLSEEARVKADPSITFNQLKALPETYAGKHIILGGIIATVKNAKDGSQLEVVNFELDSGEIPNTASRSGGRFLAVTPEFLDPLVFKKGRPVTIFGEIKGKKTQELDETDYTYPVVAIRELYLWEGPDPGIGGYVVPPLYPGYRHDPFYYGYPYDPYWHSPYMWRPIGPHYRRW